MASELRIATQRLRLGSLLCCLLLLSAPGWAGQKAQHARKAPGKAALRAHASTTPEPPVKVVVVVRDEHGQTVPNLRKSDFRLSDNNRPQRIADFGANIVLQPVVNLDVPGTVRYTALYFDDLHYDFTDTIRVTDSAYATFGPMLGARNQFGVFTASGEITLNFTSDREKFHKTLLAIRPHLPSSKQAKACPAITDYQAYLLLYVHDPLALKVAFDDMAHCGEQSGAPDPPSPRPSIAEMRQMKALVDTQARKVIAEDEVRSSQTIEKLDQLVSAMAALPDPRSIVVASPGFLTGTLARRVDELARRATRLHIIVNTLNSGGLVKQLPFPPSSNHSKENAQRIAIIAAKNEMRADRAAMTSDPLADLATMTGGNFVTNMDDLDRGFKDAAPLPQAYYVLGYFPSNLRQDGRFHSLYVSVARGQRVGVQAPAGYFAPGTPPEIAASSIRDRHGKRRARPRK